MTGPAGSRAAAPDELLRTRLVEDEDLVRARHQVRRAADLVGLATQDATRVATAVSEACRAVRRAGPATLAVTVTVTDGGVGRGPARELRVRLDSDAGRCPDGLAPGGATHAAVARLMDSLEATPTGVVMAKSLPAATATAPTTARQLQRARDTLAVQTPGAVLAAVQSQNDELVATLAALRDREAELVRLNAELEQTNRGVVALYAELEQRSEQVRKAQRAVFEELERALRPPPPQVPGVALDVRYLPAQVDSPTGGDLYDWLVLPDGTLHVTVVDVVGHGVASTRDALSVTHVVRTLVLEGHPLGDVLARADALLQAPGTEVTATVLLARLDPATGRLDLAGGGHPPALLVPAATPTATAAGVDGGAPRYLEAPGLPVGYPGAGSEGTSSAQLEPGDAVLLYTDGIVEVRRDIVEGLQTLAAAAGRARPLPLPALLDAVLAGAAAGDALDDDTLLLGLRWEPAGGP